MQQKTASWRILPLNAVITFISMVVFHLHVFERSLKLKPIKKIAHVAFLLVYNFLLSDFIL